MQTFPRTIINNCSQQIQLSWEKTELLGIRNKFCFIHVSASAGILVYVFLCYQDHKIFLFELLFHSIQQNLPGRNGHRLEKSSILGKVTSLL